MLNFDDGISIDTSGELRTTCLADGWYVIGKGMSIPCADMEDADDVLVKMTQKSN